MYANALRGRRRVGKVWSNLLRQFWFDTNPGGIDASILEDRTLFSATPLLLGDVDVDVQEDAPDTHLHLPDLFKIDDGGGQVQYKLVDNSAPGLFESLQIDPAHDLLLHSGPNQHGTAHLTLTASDASGNTEQLTVNFKVAPVNDAPTMKNLQNHTMTDTTAGVTVVDLFGAFDDVEDADQDLTFRVINNSDPTLFTSSTIDMDRGLLILQHAAGKTGTAQLTITATDSGGLSVGMDTAPTVYTWMGGTAGVNRPDYASIGVQDLKLMTHWYFFEYQENGTYDYSKLDVQKFTDLLTNYSGDPSIPVVFDIENSFYDNTPAGRDRFAEVFDLAHQLRPDLEIGLYRFMPERSYNAPVGLAAAQQHLDWGINSYYSARADYYQTAYDDWLSRNALYRTQPTTTALGGEPVADLVDSIHASLYTLTLNVDADPYYRPATLDSTADRFFVDGPSFDTVDVVRIRQSAGSHNSLGLSESHDYYVVNADAKSFQLALTPGGTPIDFAQDSTNEVFIGAVGPNWENIWHDPNVVHWQDYAEANIAEARKFGKPVYVWVSPTLKGMGAEFLDQDFFRWQLEVLRPLVDGIVIYDLPTSNPALQEQMGWWHGLSDFMGSLEEPAGTVSISISSNATHSNHAPIAQADQFNTSADTALNIAVTALLGNDHDADGDPLAATIANAPTHGTLQDLGDGHWNYTPAQDFTGTDSFQYRAFDGHQYSDPVAVTIHVAGTNHVPVAANDSLATAEDQSLSIAIAQLLANDIDADGDHLQFHLADGPTHGTLSQQADGSLVYHPDANFHGADHFTYTVHDGHASSQQAATVALNVEDVNDRPVAVADRLQTTENQGLDIDPQTLLLNDRDVEHDPLMVQVDQNPKHGQLHLSSDGTYQYVPDEGFAGTDRFTYRASDGQLLSAPAQVDIAVDAGERELSARPDAFGLAEDGHLVLRPGQLLANDQGAAPADLQIELVDAPVHGHVRWTLNGSIVYVPRKNYHGLDRFNYRITDGTEFSEVVSVQLHVKSRNDLPFVRPDTYRMDQGEVLRINGDGVMANDVDRDGDHLRVKLSRGPVHGQLSLRRDGTFAYRPEAGFHGLDSFEYRLIDQHGGVTVGAGQDSRRAHESVVSQWSAALRDSTAARPARNVAGQRRLYATPDRDPPEPGYASPGQRVEHTRQSTRKPAVTDQSL